MDQGPWLPGSSGTALIASTSSNGTKNVDESREPEARENVVIVAVKRLLLQSWDGSG